MRLPTTGELGLGNEADQAGAENDGVALKLSCRLVALIPRSPFSDLRCSYACYLRRSYGCFWQPDDGSSIDGDDG